MPNTSPKIAIIDYEMSNLFSVEHACEFIGLDAKITSNKDDIERADAAILPGVGAFGDAMANLKRLDLVQTIRDFIKSGKPFMGVCLGMQLLLSTSEEFGSHEGLNIIPGEVVKFPPATATGKPLKVPQIGWNSIHSPKDAAASWGHSPLHDLREGECMYFVHSFYTKPAARNDILAETSYEDIEYCSAILRDNVFAVQFHPEKSGPEGIRIYQNWKLTIR